MILGLELHCGATDVLDLSWLWSAPSSCAFPFLLVFAINVFLDVRPFFKLKLMCNEYATAHDHGQNHDYGHAHAHDHAQDNAHDHDHDFDMIDA